MGIDLSYSVAPFRAGYLLLAASGSAVNLYYGELDQDNKPPSWEAINYLPIADGNQTSKVMSTDQLASGTAPYLLALDDNIIEVVYAGTTSGVATGAVYGITFFDAGDSLVQLAPAQALSTVGDLGMRPSLAATTIPGQQGFLLLYGDSMYGGPNGAWCALPAYVPGQPFQLGVTTYADQLNVVPGNFSLTAVVDGVTPSDTPYVAIVGCYVDSDGGAVVFYTWRIDVSSGTPTLTAGSQIMGVAAPGMEGALFRGADGLPYWQAPAYQDFTVSQVVLPPQGSDSPLQNSVSLGIKGGSATHPSPVYFTFDALTDPVGYPNTQVVKVYRTFLTGGATANIAQDGYAERLAWQLDAHPSLGVAFGIVDSGPPFPNQNISSSPGITYGTTTFGDAASSTTGWTIAASVGGFFQYQSSEGIAGVFSVSTQFKVTIGATAGFSQSATEQSIQVVVSPSTSIDYDGTVIINPQGGVLVGTTTYIGYRYRYLDSSQQPVPNAPVYYEYYPTEWSTSVLPFDYDVDSTATIVPGNLLSYQLDPGGSLLYPSAWANGSWSSATSLNTSTIASTTGSRSVGASLGVEGSIGASIGPPGDNFTVTAGLTASFNFNYTWTSSETDQVTTVIGSWPLSDPPPPGAYASFDYQVRLLAHDTVWMQDLLALLKANTTTVNKYALAQIEPQSAPWRIVHVLTGTPELAGAGME